MGLKMAEHPLPPPELSPLPWAVDPDPREGYEWNVHIVERDHPHMRVCFMSNCSQAELNAELIVKAVNNHEALVKALVEIADPLKLEVDGIGINRALAIIGRMSSIAKDALVSVGVGGTPT
jgi:hypothetical protein